MNHIEVAWLSVLQGATEFLPVSSSGHLQIAQTLVRMHGGDLAAADNMAFTLLVHVGTLIAIFWVFRQRIMELVGYGVAGGWRGMRSEGWRGAWLENAEGRLIVAVILADIPAAIVGVRFHGFFENLYADPTRVAWVGYALLLTAVLLVSTHWRSPRRGDGEEAGRFPLWMALAVGLAQSAALFPGISRSGATIAVALLLGIRRREAGEFSFLIAIPVIIGATALEFLGSGDKFDLSPLLCLNALVVSSVSGYLFLRLLLRFVRGGRLWYFAAYCAALGVWGIWYFG